MTVDELMVFVHGVRSSPVTFEPAADDSSLSRLVMRGGRLPVLTFVYRNYKGETARRRASLTQVVPRLYFGTSEHHPGPEQWLFEAFDLDRRFVRTYAVADMSDPRVEEVL